MDLLSPSESASKADQPELSVPSSFHQNLEIYLGSRGTANTEPYQYRPLKEREIRLLELRLPMSQKSDDTDVLSAKIVHVSLNTLPKYEALSYAWGTGNSNQSMNINGKRLSIKPNLAACLRQLRRDFASSRISQARWQHHLPRFMRNFRIIWIDAICINQADSNERGSQVQLMREIYLGCARLIIWLGPACEDAPLATVFLEDLVQIKDDRDALRTLATDCLVSVAFPETYLAILRLLQSPWFRRAWIFQEYVLGAKGRAVFHYGKHKISQDSMVSLTQFLGESSMVWNTWRTAPGIADVVESLDWRVVQHQLILQWHQIHMVYEFTSTQSDHQDSTLLYYLCNLRLAASTDPRDKVYASLGMIGFQEDLLRPTTQRTSELIIDYEATVQDVYSSVVKELVLKYKRLNVLLACAHRGDLVQRSWTPDWTEDPQPRGFLATGCGNFDRLGSKNPGNFRAAAQADCVATFSADLSMLTVRGLYWATVQTLSPAVVVSSGHSVQSNESDLEPLNPFQEFFQGCWSNWISDSVFKQNSDGFKALWRTLLVRSTGTLDLDDIVASHDCPADLVVYFGDRDWHDNLTSKSLDSILDELWSICQVTSSWSHPALLAAMNENLMLDHRIFTTEHRSIGKFFRGDIEVGDVIAVILGCNAPILLRPVETQFQVLGGVYVDGVMFGEAMEMMARGEVEPRDFELI